MKCKAGVCQIAILVAAASPIVAEAHPFHWASESIGFLGGLLHPLSASDHIITMLFVGFWLSQSTRFAAVVISLLFAVLLLIGGGLTLVPLEIPYAENLMNISALILGLMLVMDYKVPSLVMALIVGHVAVFHGYVHAYDIWLDSQALAYAAGFGLGTIALITMGMFLKVLISRLMDKNAAHFIDGAER